MIEQPNIKEEIKKLAELQDIDKKIYDLNKEKSDHPRILDEIQEEFDIKKTAFKSLEEQKQKLQLKQKAKEGDLGSKEENLKKIQGQLGQLKTNKEYQAKLTEIEGLKADKSIIEEEILKAMDDIDALKKSIDVEKKKLEGDEKIFTEKKETLLARGRDIEAALQNLGGKRKILADSVNKKILERYDHILHGKEGLAMVSVKDNACAGCFMTVPHQVINEIRMYERIITCGICSRILYIDEDR